jgi:hypothetical protein
MEAHHSSSLWGIYWTLSAIFTVRSKDKSRKERFRKLVVFLEMSMVNIESWRVLLINLLVVLK